MKTASKTLLVTASLALLLAGCEKKPTGQVVAVVNGEEVSQEELNAEVQSTSTPDAKDKKQVLIQALQRLIDRKLLVQQARAEGLDKTTDYLTQTRRIEEDLAVNLLMQKAAKSMALPDAAAINRYITNNPTLFSARKRYLLDQIAFAPPSNAAVLQQIQPAHSLDAVAATLTAAGVRFSRGNGTLDTATVAPDIATKIANLPAGEPFVVPINGQYVVSVVQSVTAVPTNDADAKPAAIELLRRQGLGDAMRKRLEESRAKAKIDYKSDLAPAAGGKSGPAAK